MSIVIGGVDINNIQCADDKTILVDAEAKYQSLLNIMIECLMFTGNCM